MGVDKTLGQMRRLVASFCTVATCQQETPLSNDPLLALILRAFQTDLSQLIAKPSLLSAEFSKQPVGSRSFADQFPHFLDVLDYATGNLGDRLKVDLDKFLEVPHLGLVKSNLSNIPSLGVLPDDELSPDFSSSDPKTLGVLPAKRISLLGDPAAYQAPTFLFGSRSMPTELPPHERQSIAKVILAGLTGDIQRQGHPGHINAVGTGPSFCVGRSPSSCLLAVGRIDRGRLVAFTHNGYVNRGAVKSDHFKRLLRNSLIWASRAECQFFKDHHPELSCIKECTVTNDFMRGYKMVDTGVSENCSAFLKVGALGLSEADLNFVVQGLAGPGNIVAGIAGTDYAPETIAKVLSGHPDVIIMTNAGKDVVEATTVLAPSSKAVIDYIRQGGGVVMGLCPWGWEQGAKVSVDKTVYNQVLMEAGLRYDNAYFWGAAQIENCISLAGKPSRSELLKSSLQKLRARTIPEYSELVETVESITHYPNEAFEDLPGYSLFLKGLSPPCSTDYYASLRADVARLAQQVEETRGSWAWPLKMKAFSLNECIGGMQNAWWRRMGTLLSPPFVRPAPQIEGFPGLAPEAPRVRNFVFTLNLRLDGWQTVGVYVPPGEVVTITASDELVDCLAKAKFTKAFKVTVGPWTDSLALATDARVDLARHYRMAYRRCWVPKVRGPPDGGPFDDVQASDRSSIEVATPYGGILYLEIMDRTGLENHRAPLSFSVDGGLLMPYYNTQIEAGEAILPGSYPHRTPWKQRLLSTPALWGEIEGRYIVVLMSKQSLESLEDPRHVADYYDQVIANSLALAGQSLQRKERLVGDMQISAGALHSGYPVMGHLDLVMPNKDGHTYTLDVDGMRRDPPWGVYHEFGHNRQRSAWTWGGLGEVTVNIFSLYNTHMINGKSPYNSPYFVRNCKASALSYLKDPSQTYENKWIKVINLALSTYVQLIEEVGWKAIADTFRAYEAQTGIPALNNDVEKAREWIKQTSLASHMDLRPFYRQWRWLIDDAYLQPTLGTLPKWDKNCLQLLEALG